MTIIHVVTSDSTKRIKKFVPSYVVICPNSVSDGGTIVENGDTLTAANNHARKMANIFKDTFTVHVLDTQINDPIGVLGCGSTVIGVWEHSFLPVNQPLRKNSLKTQGV